MSQSKSKKAVDVKNLSVEYIHEDNSLTAVKNVSFSVDKQKMLGIIGETGSGKSSLIRALNGLVKFPGKINFSSLKILHAEGNDSNFDFADLRGSEVGFIPQNPFGSLNPVYKIKKQFEFVNKRHQIFNKKDLDDKVNSALAEVGINDPERVSNSYSFEMSGGMAQRVVIALATFSKPNLLFADEPTTGLDVTVERQLLDNFFKLVKNKNMTLVVVTHDLGIVAQYCDEALVMYEGEIVERGPINNIFTDPQDKYTQQLIRASSEEIN
jgi:ABC-type dipeptide/oligopeptide/nickel transport system ATPase component